jgi:hypothetical protein
MKTYKMLAPVTLRSGTVRLTKEQAKGRGYKLAPIKSKQDHYTLTAPNQFKADEVIGYDGDIPKIHAALVVDVEKIKPTTTAKPIDPQNVIDIIDVLDALDRDKDFTEGGKPEVKAIEALLDRNVTAAERDAAWAEYQKTQQE